VKNWQLVELQKLLLVQIEPEPTAVEHAVLPALPGVHETSQVPLTQVL